jgi:hypothetical protein
VLRPAGAAPQATGMPCIVFAGNVRGDQALLNAHQQDPEARRIAGGRKPVTMRSYPGQLQADYGATSGG